MSNNEGHYVTACNSNGLVVYTRYIEAESAIDACSKARKELRRTHTNWWTIFAGDPARPDHMVTTKEGRAITESDRKYEDQKRQIKEWADLSGYNEA